MDSREMRKPVPGGQAALLPNVAAAVATAVALAPLSDKYAATAAPLSVQRVGLRAAHAAVREVAYHYLERGAPGGAIAWAAFAGCFTEPLRAAALAGSQGALLRPMGGPELACSAVMNTAPQLARALAAFFLNGAPAATKASRYVQICIAALSRVILCLFLLPLAMRRSGGRVPVGAALTHAKLLAYMSKELLALGIETGVHAYMR
jgi:hypothetical protein